MCGERGNPGYGYDGGSPKEEIGRLSEPERKELFDWLEELEEDAWDREMERDFSPDGRGSHLVEKINREVDDTILSGPVTSLEIELRACRERRAPK